MTSWQQPIIAPPSAHPPMGYPPMGYPPMGYAPMAPPPMAPTARPLPPEHAQAARRAGALGGALAGVGTMIAGSPIAAWGFVSFFVLVGPISQRQPGSTSAAELGTAFTDVMTSPTAIVAAIVCLVVGLALIVLGVLLSVRRLRRAGVRRPVAVTLLGIVLTRVATIAIGTVLGGLLEIAAFSWIPALMIGAIETTVEGSDAQALGGMQLAGGIATALIAIVGLLLAAGSWLGIGILAWWWMAFAFRDRRLAEGQGAWSQAAAQPAAQQPAAQQPAAQQSAGQPAATQETRPQEPAAQQPVDDERAVDGR